MQHRRRSRFARPRRAVKQITMRKKTKNAKTKSFPTCEEETRRETLAEWKTNEECENDDKSDLRGRDAQWTIPGMRSTGWLGQRTRFRAARKKLAVNKSEGRATENKCQKPTAFPPAMRRLTVNTLTISTCEEETRREKEQSNEKYSDLRGRDSPWNKNKNFESMKNATRKAIPTWEAASLREHNEECEPE